MATRKIIDAKHNGEKVWLKGHAQATFMSDGSTVEDAINNMKAEDGGITTELDPIFSASPAAKITDNNISSWNNKVDKVDGKQLSTEDFTTVLMNKLSGLNNYDDTALNQAIQSLQTQLNMLVSGNASSAVESFNEIIAFLEGIEDSQSLDSIIASIEQQIAGKMNKVTLAAVATSGNYDDLSNKPTIPNAVTESIVSGWGFTKNTGTYSKPSTGIPKSDLASGVQTSLGKAETALQSHQDISGKQDKLVSGTNIKTINGTSILGSGDIVISGGGSSSGGGGAYVEVNHGTGDTTFALTPNTFHVWDEVSSLDLSFADEQAGVANEFLFQFTSGATATTLTLPDGLKWANDSAPTIAENMIYQVSVLKGLASVLEFSKQLLTNYAQIKSDGIITFTYPVASDLTIEFSGRTTGSPTGSPTFMTTTIASGEQSVSTGATSIFYINSITPDSDSKYNYTFDIS